MTWEEFLEKAERSPFTAEIIGEYNDLRAEGYTEDKAMKDALALGEQLAKEAYNE